MNTTELPYGTGSIIFIERNRIHPYCARKYKGNNRNGNPTYYIVGYFATYEEARDALLAEADSVASDLENQNLTFAQVFDHYVKSHDTLAKETIKYKNRLGKDKCSAIANKKYRDIKADDMIAVIHSLNNTCERRLMKTLLKQLDDEADMLDIPGKRYARYLPRIMPKPTDTRHDRFPFTENEMMEFITHIHQKDMYLVLFLCYTGFRKSAAVSILKTDVDLINMTVTGGIKTEAGRHRTIPIHPVIQPIVNGLMKLPGTYLLPSKDGKPMSTYELDFRFQMAIAPYVERHHVLHECRHTFRTKLDEGNVEEYIICALMGHIPPDAGQRYYARATLEKKREAIMKLWPSLTE